MRGASPRRPGRPLAAVPTPSTQFATQTAYMLSLGLSRSLATFTWVAGPISGACCRWSGAPCSVGHGPPHGRAGLVVQPIVGSLSDRTQSRLGKRVPFLVGV